MDYTSILQNMNSSIEYMDSPITSLFSYLNHIYKAIEVTTQYVSQLPDYFRIPVLAIIPISILLFILGR